jgi:shikimate dehydrogenase
MYGLIGYPLSHSFSKKFFSDKFATEGLSDVTYDNFAIPSIAELPGLLKNPSIYGLNVTIPYKEQVIPFLDWQDEVVEKTGACNCIRIQEGKLRGFNTDVAGFERALKRNLQPHHTSALVLGTGGAAKAISYVLRKLSINFLVVSRSNTWKHPPGSLRYEELTGEILASHLLIINTTPLGMYPDVDESPPIDYEKLTPGHYLFDAIYNPAKTRFLERGEKKGATIQNGLEMLIVQAEESWKIWTGL